MIMGLNSFLFLFFFSFYFLPFSFLPLSFIQTQKWKISHNNDNGICILSFSLSFFSFYPLPFLYLFSFFTTFLYPDKVIILIMELHSFLFSFFLSVYSLPFLHLFSFLPFFSLFFCKSIM